MPLSLLRLVGVLCFAVGIVPQQAEAYVLNGKSWPAGTTVFQLGLGSPVAPLSDGSTSWNAAILPVLDMWNQKMGNIQLSGVMDSTAPVSSGDRVNSIVFANNIFGQSFGSGTLAVTYYITQGANYLEADVLFNRAQTFDSYRGPLRFGGPGGYATGDVRRVLLHELGHALGLNHADGDNIMAPVVSNREVLSNDDVAAVQSIYGAASTPPPNTNPSRLANISTRVRVGLNDDALIGGFIVGGSQPKRVIIRATGPSMAGAVAGVLADPTLEVYDGSGHVVATNDNWQSGSQSADITATGVAPTNPLEPALVATLSPGGYTAIVRGANNGQGIALIEVYELDTTSGRLLNISTRGQIGINEEVLIGGMIVTGSAGKKVIVRAIGPSLAGAIAGALANPSLEMYNGSGTRIAANDDWQNSSQSAEITASSVAPSNSLESAIVTTLAPGGYTAIVRGVNNGTGIGLVEAYDLEP